MENENLRKVENKKPNIMEEILYHGKVSKCLKGIGLKNMFRYFLWKKNDFLIYTFH